MALLLFLLPLNLYALTIATYNVQNHFDNNPSKNAQLERVIKAMGYPEFLALQEVESTRSLSKFTNYKIIMAQIRDKRGMGVALLYRKGKLLKKRELKVANSRSILEARIKLENSTFTFFVVHWPSQRNPPNKRIQAAKTLIKRIRELENEYFVILGDFNYDPDFESIPSMEMRGIVNLDFNGGTYFYIPYRRWSKFDRILWSRNFKGIYEYKIFQPDFIAKQMIYNGRPEKIPWRYDAKKHVGYSDHFPVYLKFHL
ncbi:MAG: hypothetical protein E2O68_06365 [Deltaproteobacteria bacterium]|nr:MAG: hypothetical protein E2O68_06365 [Deltaproteobacteria bacterium]